MVRNQEEPRLFSVLFRTPFQILDTRIDEGLIAAGYTDLRPAYFEVFRYIRSEGSRSTELAEQAQITKQSMGYLIDHLEDQGYVERIPDPQDRRAKIVQLTKRGQEVEKTAQQIILQVEAEWTELLGAEKMAQLRQKLEMLLDILERE